MKKFFAATLFIVIAYSTCAQAVIWTIGNKEWLPAVVLKSDQHALIGLVKEFGVANTFEFRGPWDNFTSMESKLHMDQKSFDFKEDLNSESQKISINEVASITLLDDEQIPVRYDKIKLKTINTKMEVIDLQRQVLAPLVREGKINLYAIPVRICASKCTLGPVIAYIRKPDGEFAFIPIDINRVNLFNLGSLEGRVVESFRQVGNDCPSYLQYLDQFQQNYKDKDFRKQLKARWKSVDKEKKVALKNVHGSKERRKVKDAYFVKRFLTFEIAMIEKYEELCK